MSEDAVMRMTIRHRAGEGERFAPDAFRIGGEVAFRTDDGVCLPAVLVDAQVADDGTWAALTFELAGSLYMPR